MAMCERLEMPGLAGVLSEVYQYDGANRLTLAMAKPVNPLATKFDLKVSVTLDVRTGEETFATMSTTPNEAGGFTGYSLHPLARGVLGPYSPGNFTDVVVNASRGWIPATIYHELRHVLLGDFGRVAPYGAHGTGRVDRETVEAEKEAVRNQVEVLRNQR